MRRSCPKDLDLETLLKAGTLLYYREGASADGVGQAAHRHDDAGRRRQDRRVEPRRHADAEAGRAPAAAAARQPARRRHHRPRQRRHASARRCAIRSRAPTSSRSRRRSSRPRASFAAENSNALADPRTQPDRRRRPLAPAADRRSSTTSSSRSRRIPGLPASRRSSRASSSWRRAIGSRRAASSASGPTPTTSATPISARSWPRSDRCFRTAPSGWSARTMCCWWGRRGRGRSPIGSARSRALAAARRGRRSRRRSRRSSRSRCCRSIVGGPDELARYAAGAAILTDDRMTLEFSGAA